ncbi:MAG: hypothetical protein AB7F75_03820 [Planctomycetota bacterium]
MPKYGICNRCGFHSDTTDAYCPKCQYPWAIFMAKPKEVEPWLERKGIIERAKRCFPPPIYTGIHISMVGCWALFMLDLWAWWRGVHLTRWSGPWMWGSLAAFDLILFFYVFRTLCLSLHSMKMARLLMSLSLVATGVVAVHHWTRVEGHYFINAGGNYLTPRLMILGYQLWIIWQSRIKRTIIRHGAPARSRGEEKPVAS